MYTIGLSPTLGFELIFAGGSYYQINEMAMIVGEIVKSLCEKVSTIKSRFKVGGLGHFALKEVESGWVNSLMLGAIDFYPEKLVLGLQIVPNKKYRTIDTPNLSVPWSLNSEPVWRYLYEPWNYAIEPDSIVVTNIDALQGGKVTEVVR